MKVTEHAFERGKQRVGLNIKAFERLAKVAWQKGYSVTDFKEGRMRDYMRELFLYNSKAGAIKLYGHHVYVFTVSGILITVLHIPTTHRNYRKYLLKKKDA